MGKKPEGEANLDQFKRPDPAGFEWTALTWSGDAEWARAGFPGPRTTYSPVWSHAHPAEGLGATAGSDKQHFSSKKPPFRKLSEFL